MTFQFDSFADFLDMGGYAFYVWVAYGAFFAVMGWNLLQARAERRRTLQLLRARRQREAVRAQAANPDPLHRGD
jgi:heme exporter protein D